MKSKKVILLIASALINFYSFSQDEDDLFAMLEDDEEQVSEPVFATFKTTRLINTYTNETLGKGDLDFRIDHRFGNMSDGYEVLYGFDDIADMRLAFEYGISENLMIGLGRSKGGFMDGFIKYKTLEQTTDNKMPVGLTLFANTGIEINDGEYDEFAHRVNYAYQAIIARKQGDFSFVLSPTLVHQNIADSTDQNDLFALGVGVRYAFTKSSSVIIDYFHNFDNLRQIGNGNFFPPIGIGYEVETGGHVFQIMLTNATYITPNRFVTSTIDNPMDGDIKFAFNISRVF